jgi:hypothetical protein
MSNLRDFQQKATQLKPGRIAAICADAHAKVALKEWEARGWKVAAFDGELPTAIAGALEAASRHEVDMIYGAGNDTLSLARLFEKAVPKEHQPLSLLHAVEVPAFPRMLWFGCLPSGRYEVIPEITKALQTMIRALTSFGNPEPKVALLSCVEMVSPGVASTVWEATIGQMSNRGQFGKAKVDGPLAFDLAVSMHAVEEKNLKSEVGGHADLLVPPDLGSFCSLVDGIHLTGEHEAADILVGGPCPIALSRPCSQDHATSSLSVAAMLTA